MNHTTRPPQTGESAGEGAVKTGLYLGTDLSSSKPAADGEDGLAQANINLVAVTISEDGVIDECVIDAVQSKVNFDAAGAITTDLSAPVSSKNELGDAYGMKKASSIGKEWYEQVQALADYVEGKTLDEIRGIAVTEDGKAGEADLAASVTISIAGYLDAIEEAAANATYLGAMAGGYALPHLHHQPGGQQGRLRRGGRPCPGLHHGGRHHDERRHHHQLRHRRRAGQREL